MYLKSFFSSHQNAIVHGARAKAEQRALTRSLSLSLVPSIKQWRTLGGAVLGAGLLFIGGCTTSAGSMPTDVTPPTKSVENLDSWDVQGRIGLQTAQARGSASLVWRQRPEDFSIRIRAPLNAANIELTGNDQQAKLVYNANREYTAATLADLKNEVPKIAIPFENLHYWVRGLPNPAYQVTEVNQVTLRSASSPNNVYTGSFKQDGWSLTFGEQRNIDGYILPTRIIALKGADRFTILVKDWTL